MKIVNAFSLNMIEEYPVIIRIEEVLENWVKEQIVEFESYIGHPDTANLLTERLGVKILFNRATLKIKKGDQILVAQLMGPRKEFKELTKEEIQSYPIKYFIVTVEDITKLK
jgi:hypothetical protein